MAQSMSPNKIQKPCGRKRVPLSCLICKKRKVKCDKIKPACSGCQKNGVAHLCKYMEPEWARENEIDERYKEVMSNDTEVPQIAKDNTRRTLSHQRDEIERLKRTLEIQQQLLGRESRKDEKINVLERLAPGYHDRNEKIEVSNDSFYIVSYRDSNWEPLNDMLSLLSSPNIIKLDFQLVSFWGQISHLKQLYLTYRKNEGHLEKDQRKDFGKNFGQKKITEVDFTYAKSLKPTYVEGRCPVLHCDLNLVRGIGHGSIKSEKSDSLDLRETSVMKETAISSEKEKVGEPGKRMLISIQKIWNAAITFANKKMNYEQTCFLINFYFSTNNEIGGSELFCLFKDEIFNLIKKDGNRVYLNCLGVETNTDDEQYLKLGFEGIYICMIALIIEVSLIQLGNNAKVKKCDQVSEDFRILFPETYGVSDDWECKRHNVFHLVRDFMSTLSLENSTYEMSLFQKSLPFISCLLNFVILKLETTDICILKDYRQLIPQVFELTLNPVFEISKNPEIFTFNGQDTSIKIRALRLHFCYMWSNVMRSFNIIVIHYFSVNTKENIVNQYKDKFYDLVEETYSKGYHLNCVSHYDNYALAESKKDLEDQFLVARICGALNNGVYFGSQAYLTVYKLDGMMVECDKWLSNNRIDNVLNSKYLETYCSISYLRVHMSFIKFLHTEHGKDEDTQRCAFLDLLSIFSRYALLLNALLRVDLKNHNYFSILNVAVESLSRLVHIALALYLRLTYLPKYGSYQLSQNFIEIMRKNMALFNFYGNEKEVSLNPPDFLVHIVSRTLETQLESFSVNSKLQRLSRLWSFCSTLVRTVGRRVGDNVKLHVPEQDLGVHQELDSRHCPLTHSLSGEMWSKLHPHVLAFQYSKPECPILQITTPKTHSSGMSSFKKAQESIYEQGTDSRKKCPFHKTAPYQEDETFLGIDVGDSNRSYGNSDYTHFRTVLESSLNETPKETIPSRYENSFENVERGSDPDQLNLSRATGDFGTFDLTDVDLDFLQTEPMIDEFDIEIFGVDTTSNSKST